MRSCLLVALSAVLCVSCADEKAKAPAAVSPGPEGSPGAPGPAASVKPLPDPLPEIIAKVNGRPLYVQNAIMVAERLMGPTPLVTPEQRANAFRAAMEQLIARELLFQEAVARKTAPDTAVVERSYDERRARFKTDAEWRTFLKQQGLDEQGFRTELRVQHTVEALLRKEAAKVPGSEPEAEMRAFYEANPSQFEVGERVRVSHILLRVPKDAAPALKAEQKRKAEELRARIVKGAAFATVARESSEDGGSADQGGALPPVPRGVMAPPFEEAAFALEPGALSPVVETAFGYHIIRLEERLPPEKETFEHARDRIKEHLLVLRRQAAVKALLEHLKSKAQIETFL